MSRITIPKTELQDLPNDVLDKIASGIDSIDLINLVKTVPELYDVLKDSYKIITDLVDDSYDSLPNGFYTTVYHALQSEDIRHFKGTLFLEYHEIETSWTYFLEFINSLSQQTSCEIIIYNISTIPTRLQEEFHCVSALTAAEPGFIKQIYIPELTTLHFLELAWDPSVFRLPKLTSLGLGDTTLVDNAFGKPEFPALERAYIEGSLIGDLSILEIPKTLHFYEINKHLILENLKSDNLEFLKIESSHAIEKIDNMDFPNLKHLEIIGTNISIISNFKADSLLNLIHESNYFSTISIENFEAKSLNQIEIIATSIDHITDVHFPNLQYVSLRLSDQQVPVHDFNPVKFLEKVKVIEITHCIQILEGLKLENLKALNFHDDTTYRLSSNTKFPALKKLLISHNEVIQQVPLINAPNLEDITIVGSFNFVSINNLPTDYPLLKSLVIDNCSLSFVSGLEFPNLEELEIQSDISEIVFTDNKLPNLKKLHISPKSNHLLRGYPRSRLQFEGIVAPNLEELTLSGVSFVSLFSTRLYPKLQSLTIDKITDLEISSSNNLNSLNLSLNCAIPNLRLGDLKNLIEFYPPKTMDAKTLEWIENLKKGASEEDIETAAEQIEGLNI